MVGKIQVEIYDTTLRDGAQGEGVDFSVDNKAHIAGKLDEMGDEDGPGLLVHYVEGGYPGSNPKDIAFFKRMKENPLRNVQLTAFGSTRYKDKKPNEDKIIRALLRAETDIVTIFGKSWDFQVEAVLKTDLQTNLDMIRGSVAYLVEKGKRVFFDAEHFFSGCVGNPERGLEGNMPYALETLVAAAEGGAERIILCDTNGGVPLFNNPQVVAETVDTIRGRGVDVPFGIHAHNDGGFAVANSIYFVDYLVSIGEKLVQVQGTINGFGERTGNADLVQIVANLYHLGVMDLPKAATAHLTAISRYVYEMAGMEPEGKQPFVGTQSGHKGGMHVNAIRKDPRTYEHYDLAAFGNTAHLVASDQAGKATYLEKAREFGLKIDEKFALYISRHIKRREHEGYSFSAADASLELEMIRELGRGKDAPMPYRPIMNVGECDISSRKIGDKGAPVSRAVLEASVGGEERYAVARKTGPIEAMEVAMKDLLSGQFPYVADVRVVDYRVHMVEPKKGAAAVVRVLVTSKDKQGNEWTTVGAHKNIIEASRIALLDAYEFGIRKYAPEQLKP